MTRSRRSRPAGPAPDPRVPSPRRPPAPLRTLVVIGGLPGAGKTTLLRRLAADGTARALDSEDVAAVLSRLPVPYRALRPLVHGAHLARVLLAAGSSAPCVLTTDPLTSALRRLLLRGGARLSGRRLVVVLVAVTPAQARDGQRRRGRVLGERRMAGHEQRYRHLWERGSSPADVVLTREQAASAPTLAAVLQRQGAPDPGARAGLVVR